MSESEISTEQTFSASDRPGHRLAEARKARGITLEEVAAQLRLNVGMLQALENDDYSRLPPAAFVSGYLRSYARALGMSEAELNPATSGSAEPPLVGVVARSQTAEVRASDPRVRLVTYLVLGGLFVVSSAWWLVQREEESAAATAVEEPAPMAPVAVDPALVAATPAEGAAPTTTENTAAPLPPVVAAPETKPAAPAAPAPKPATPAPAVKPAEPNAAAMAAAQAATAATPPAPVEAPKPETPPPPPLTADVPQSKVVLEFTADCWVEVADAAGRALAYELAPAGRKLTLRGEAPFKVFFGYTPGVQVSFNDEAFDHMPFSRRDVARFKLGTAEDNSLPTEAAQ